MKKHLYLPAIALSAVFNVSLAQSPFPTIEYNDINNIKAGVLVHGDMWWDPANTQEARCEFPKGNGTHINFAGSLWMAGYDTQGGGLHVSAQTYRQSGNDYWPGPLDVNGSLDYSTSEKWARIWKINKTTIDSFKMLSNHTLLNTHLSILTWPAKNNPYAKGTNGVSLLINTDMAPFVDVNSDGSYNPLQGDYPKIKGDQMLWWVFSDNGPSGDTTTPTPPFQIEIHASAYGFKRNTLIDNVLYYEFYLNNRSSLNYDSLRIGLNSDVDLGDYRDDFVGFDSVFRMGYVYNGKSIDGDGGSHHYGVNIPVSGVTILRQPGDMPNSYTAAGSFMYYNNWIWGNSMNANDYNNYLRATWKDGTHVKYGADGYTGSHDVDYMYTGDPGVVMKWTECTNNNIPGDRRYILASNDFSLNAGGSALFAVALVTTNPAPNNGCPNASINELKIVADTAWGNFGHPLGVNGAHVAKNQLRIYPNPAQERIYIEVTGAGELYIHDAIGRKIRAEYVRSQNRYEVNTAMLAPGIYNAVFRGSENVTMGTFIKE